MRRALAIDEQSLGKDHPKVAIRLNNLAQLLKATNRLKDAEPLYRRALDVFAASLGWDHPNTQTVAANYFAILAELKGVSVEALLQGMQGESGSSRGVAPAVELPAKGEDTKPERRGWFSRMFHRR